jgi:hypothetical protein
VGILDVHSQSMRALLWPGEGPQVDEFHVDDSDSMSLIYNQRLAQEKTNRRGTRTSTIRDAGNPKTQRPALSWWSGAVRNQSRRARAIIETFEKDLSFINIPEHLRHARTKQQATVGGFVDGTRSPRCLRTRFWSCKYKIRTPS